MQTTATGAREALRCAFEENCIFSVLKETRRGEKSIHEEDGERGRRRQRGALSEKLGQK